PRGPIPASGAEGRGGRRRGLCEQLVDDLAARSLLRPVRPALPARSPVVPGDRGAVLSRLAMAPAARPALRARAPQSPPGPPAPGRHHLGAGGRLGDRDGAAVSPGVRFLAGL